MSEKNKAYSLEKLTENLKKLIQDAAEGPLEERTNHKNPLFVGKKIIHKFNEGEWSGRVISVVKGFPDFYNVVYDCDLNDQSNPVAIYTYKLKDDYKEGNLRIVPEVRKKKNLIAGANTQVETLWEMHNLSTDNLFQRCTKYTYTD